MTERETRKARRISGPARAALAWLGAVFVGAVLLRLPVSASGDPLSWIDSLFTSTSALCVTGLSTISVGQRLSPFGQGVLLGLIQLGGLGIMTVSTFLLVTAGRATLAQQIAAKDTLVALRIHPIRLLWWVIALTIAIETIGTVLLKERLGTSGSWWIAGFHSISAFCNAGFSIFPDSLVGYRGDVSVNAIMAGLIVLGGLGFIALQQIISWGWAMVRGRRVRLPLHSRCVLTANALLWVLGFLLFAVYEWHGAMDGLTVGKRLLTAGFQSVTTRTAGFNSLDFSVMREPTLYFTMFFMLIGGAPGGCAGGIKVTTMVVILAAVRARLRGADKVTLFRRSVSGEVVWRSFLLAALAVIFLTIIVSGLLVTEEARPVSDVRSDRYMLLAFEAVSAFGTVGLSAGVTTGLSVAGKLLIISCMFIGRLGPLAVALAVLQPKRKPLFEYPEEELAIG